MEPTKLSIVANDSRDMRPCSGPAIFAGTLFAILSLVIWLPQTLASFIAKDAKRSL